MQSLARANSYNVVEINYSRHVARFAAKEHDVSRFDSRITLVLYRTRARSKRVETFIAHRANGSVGTQFVTNCSKILEEFATKLKHD